MGTIVAVIMIAETAASTMTAEIMISITTAGIMISTMIAEMTTGATTREGDFGKLGGITGSFFAPGFNGRVVAAGAKSPLGRGLLRADRLSFGFWRGLVT